MSLKNNAKVIKSGSKKKGKGRKQNENGWKPCNCTHTHTHTHTNNLKEEKRSYIIEENNRR